MDTFDDFAKKIVTKEDLIFLLDQINLVEGLIFKNINIPLSERVKGEVSEDFGKGLEEWEKKKIISRNPEENRIFFENFKNYLQNLPQIKIEIAFQPKKEFMNKISFWLKKELNKNLVLDLTLNPEIVGGAIIEYKGKYFAFSLAKKIDELISQKIS